MTIRKHKKQLIFPLLIIATSVLNFIAFNELMDIISIIVSLIGIWGVILYFRNSSYNVFLYRLWIVLQVPQIWIEYNYGTSIDYKSLFETTNILKYNLGPSFYYDDLTTINFKINVLAFIYYLIYKLTILKKLTGRGIKVSQLNIHGKLAPFFPIHAEIIKRIQVENENEWFLLSLNEPIILDEIRYDRIIIDSKESDLRKKKTKKETDIRLIKEGEDINNKAINKSNYPFVEWVLVELY